MKTVQYGLRKKGSSTLLKWNKVTFSQEKSLDVFVLDETGENTWYADTFREAHSLRINPCRWYETTQLVPFHTYDSNELEVVKIVCFQKEEVVENEETIGDNKEETNKMLKLFCLKSISRDLDNILVPSTPEVHCFVEGKYYLSYIKDNKLYALNEDEIPELICKVPSDKGIEDDLYFQEHFSIIE